jgi:hypothetical protein
MFSTPLEIERNTQGVQVNHSRMRASKAVSFHFAVFAAFYCLWQTWWLLQVLEEGVFRHSN